VTQMVSAERAAALRNKCLSLAKTGSIGFRSGDYFGRKKSLAPAARMSWRTASFYHLVDEAIVPLKTASGPDAS
jgi:hypothetical protein